MSAFLANRTARWGLGTAALCLVLLLAAWFLLISPRRDDATALRDQATASDQQAQLLQIKLTQLTSQAKELPQQKAKLKEIADQLTPDADIPQYLRDLQDTAATAGVNLGSVTPGTPTLVTLTGGTAAAAAGSGSGLGQSGDLVSIPMNLSLTGDYYQLSEWLKQLQTKVQRSYLISAFSLTPDGGTASDGGTTSGTTSGTDSTASVTATTDALSGAAIDDAAVATSAPTATSKGTEGATPTASSADGTTGDGATATATATATVTSSDWALSLTGTVFVLLSDDSTLAEVTADAAAAQASLGGVWTEITPSATPTATGTPTTTATTNPSATAGSS